MNSNSPGGLAMKRLARGVRGGILMLAALVLLALNPGCQSSGTTKGMFGGNKNEQPVVTLAAAENSNMTIRWKTLVGMSEALHERVTSVTRSKNNLYVVTNRNQLVMVDAAAGTMVWNLDIGEDWLPIFPPVEVTYNKKPALAVYSRLKLYLVDRRDGKIINISFLPFSAASQGIANNNILCIGGEHQFFYGTYIDLFGRVAWSVREENDSFVAAPVVTIEGTVVFCSKKGMIWKVSMDKGLAGWNHKTTGDVVGGLVADSHAVYIPCLDRKLYAFELVSSKRLWAARLDGKLDQAPMLAGANVLAVGAGSGLYAVDIIKGETHWFVPNVRQILSRTADHVMAADTSGNILAVNLDTGSVDSTTPTNQADLFVTNTIDGTVYAVSGDGRIVALEAAK